MHSIFVKGEQVIKVHENVVRYMKDFHAKKYDQFFLKQKVALNKSKPCLFKDERYHTIKSGKTSLQNTYMWFFFQDKVQYSVTNISRTK